MNKAIIRVNAASSLPHLFQAITAISALESGPPPSPSTLPHPLIDSFPGKLKLKRQSEIPRMEPSHISNISQIQDGPMGRGDTPLESDADSVDSISHFLFSVRRAKSAVPWPPLAQSHRIRRQISSQRQISIIIITTVLIETHL